MGATGLRRPVALGTGCPNGGKPGLASSTSELHPASAGVAPTSGDGGPGGGGAGRPGAIKVVRPPSRLDTAGHLRYLFRGDLLVLVHPGESAQGGGAERLICLTQSKVALAPMQDMMAPLEVCLRRRTLRCASSSSSRRHQTLASSAAKVLATAKCRKARHLVVGPPPSCGRSTALGQAAI